jgi:hypothetical protein
LQPNNPQYNELLQKINLIDEEISSGVFLALAFIVGKRLFTVNVGK